MQDYTNACEPRSVTAMKTNTIIQITIQALLLGAVVFAVQVLKPPFMPSPTPKIVITSNPQKSVDQNKSTVKSATLQNTQPQQSVSKVASLSPKYDDIKESVNREYMYRMFTTPNDPSYTSDWTMAKVNAPAAWDVSTGNGQTVVAVIDSGFALAHEELSSNWYTNAAEMGTTQNGDHCWTGASAGKQTNNCDDDANGYVDDWRGWSFILGDNNPQTGRENPTGQGIRHGSQVAGLAGAVSNNGVGIASLAWNTKIMPLQALDDDGTGYTSDVTAAVFYAVDNGAQVINLSLGSYANDPAMKNAINYAAAHNVVIVAAAGNCGDGGGAECVGVPVGTIAYPAAYPNAISVGATTATDQRASFSSYGSALDVVAPGYNVPMSTSWSASNQTALYATGLYGTSFSSPIVASLVALIKSIRPTTSIGDILALIDATATKPSGMGGLPFTPQFGHGIINAGSALSIASTLNGAGSGAPTLLQAGTSISEHVAMSNTSLGSGCITAVGSVCTVQMTSDDGHIRFLPYTIVPVGGQVGWTWSSDMLDQTNWEIRARTGSTVSSTPYSLLRKG